MKDIPDFKHHHLIWGIVITILAVGLFVLYNNILENPVMDFENFQVDDIPILGDFEKFLTPIFVEFTKNEIFQQLGVLITFLYSATPSVIPVPNEVFMTPVILAQPTPQMQLDQAIFLIIITSIGGFIGDSAVFFVAKHHLHKIIRRDKPDEPDEEDKFNKYGLMIFLFSPSLMIGGGLAEVPLIIAGHKQYSWFRIAPFLFGGNMIRGTWGGLILLSVLGLLF